MTDYNVSQAVIDSAMEKLAAYIEDEGVDLDVMLTDIQSRIESWAQSRYGDSWADMSMIWLAREYWADQGYVV